MPFDQEFQEVYDLFIRRTLEDAGSEVSRADDLLNQQSILKDIIESIFVSDLVIADLTDLNPNVLYELGIAHTMDKKVCLLTQNVEELPFDLRSYRVIPYSVHFAKIEEARKRLQQTVEDAARNRLTFSNPIRDFAPNFLQGLPSIPSPSDEDRGQTLTKGDSLEQEPEEHDEEDQEGFLDHVAHVEEDFASLTGLLDQVNTATERLGLFTKEKTEEWSRAVQNQGSGVSVQLRSIARDIGTEINQYASLLAEKNLAYGKLWARISESLDFIVNSEIFANSSSREDAVKLLDSLKKLEDVVVEVRPRTSEFRNSIARLDELKLERHLSRASRQADKELESFIGNLDITASSARRVRIKGMSKFEGEEGHHG